MNKLFLISFLLIAIAIGSLAVQVRAAQPKCPDGYDLVAGLCYAPCPSGEQKTQFGWCRKTNGILYLPKAPVKST